MSRSKITPVRVASPAPCSCTKIAGHHAEAGAPLETVAAEAGRVAKAVKSLGIATTVCTIPGQPAHGRLNPGQAELGLGIHGEPGIERIELPLAGDVAELMAERLERAAPSGPVALLVNNLGGTPDLEMGVVCHSLLATKLGARAKYIVGPARLMTALDMKGVSISVLPLDDSLVAALTSDCRAPAWPGANKIAPPEVLPMPRAEPSVTEIASNEPKTRATLIAVCEALIKHESELNALDARVGDGDTGTTFAVAARTVLSAIDAMPLAAHDRLCAAIGRRLSETHGRHERRAVVDLCCGRGPGAWLGRELARRLARGAQSDAILRRRRAGRPHDAGCADAGGGGAGARRRSGTSRVRRARGGRCHGEDDESPCGTIELSGGWRTERRPGSWRGRDCDGFRGRRGGLRK